MGLVLTRWQRTVICPAGRLFREPVFRLGRDGWFSPRRSVSLVDLDRGTIAAIAPAATGELLDGLAFGVAAADSAVYLDQLIELLRDLGRAERAAIGPGEDQADEMNVRSGAGLSSTARSERLRRRG
jgi:hypothetical protein